MIKLKRFQLPVAKCRTTAFDFERASLALLARHQHRRAIALSLPMTREWRDPVTHRVATVVHQGVGCNG